MADRSSLRPSQPVPRAVALAVAILIAITALGWSSDSAQRVAERHIEHAHAVLERVTALRSDIVGEQGTLTAYLLTRDADSLVAFRAQVQVAQRHRDELRALTSGDTTPMARGAQRAARLDALAGVVQRIVDARAERLTDAPAAVTTSDRAVRQHEATALLDSLEYGERQSLRERSAASRQASGLRLIALFAALLAAAGLGAWAVRTSRHEARAVEALSARYQMLADQNPDAILVQTAGRIRFANAAASRLLGFAEPAAMLDAQLCELVHPHERVEARAREHAVTTLRCILDPVRRRFVRVDGSVVETEERAAPFVFAGLPGSEIVIRDLTAQLAAEEVLAASEQRFRVLLDAMQEGVVLQNAASDILLWNPAAEQILGLTTDHVSGRTSHDARLRFIDESGAPLHGDAHPTAEALRTGAPAIRVIGIARPALAQVWILANAVPLIRCGESVPYAVETTFTDFTESRVSATRLADSEARYRILAEHSIDLISRRSIEHRFEYVSPSHEAVLGWSQDEMLGHSAAEFLHPDDAVRLPELLTDSAAAHTVARMRHKAGHYLWVDAIASPMRDEAGNVIGYQVAARDVTERRALEEQLRHAQKMDAMSRMASGVAHDFNNLLVVIQGSCELLRGSTRADEESVSLLADVLLATNRAASLTAQLLTFARLQHSVPERLNAMALLRRVYPLLSRLAGADISVELSCADGADVAMIDGEAVQIEQVIFNLVVNARDALPAGGTLGIRCELSDAAEGFAHRHGSLEAGRYVTLRVSDTGTGMTEDVQAKLFDPYYTTKAQGKGTGLGLATVAGIVQRAHGTVVVESKAGAGSTVTVYWPLSTASPLAPNHRAASDAAVVVTDAVVVASRFPSPCVTGTGSEALPLVVLVDDETLVLRALAGVLRRCGYEVHAVESASAALKVFRAEREKVRALVTDIRMPVMGGIELVDVLQRERIDVPVLFMSGQLDVPIPSHWPPTVPRIFLAKPFSTSELALSMQHLLASERTTAA